MMLLYVCFILIVLTVVHARFNKHVRSHNSSSQLEHPPVISLSNGLGEVRYQPQDINGLRLYSYRGNDTWIHPNHPVLSSMRVLNSKAHEFSSPRPVGPHPMTVDNIDDAIALSEERNHHVKSTTWRYLE